VRDLLLASRVTTAARAAGAPVQLVRDPAALAEQQGERLVVDLNQPGALDAAARWKGQQPDLRRVIGFVSHVDGETIAAARQAGLDHVLARSALAEKLPRLLATGR
jgi:hypothetical protein